MLPLMAYHKDDHDENKVLAFCLLRRHELFGGLNHYAYRFEKSSKFKTIYFMNEKCFGSRAFITCVGMITELVSLHDDCLYLIVHPRYGLSPKDIASAGATCKRLASITLASDKSMQRGIHVFLVNPQLYVCAGKAGLPSMLASLLFQNWHRELAMPVQRRDFGHSPSLCIYIYVIYFSGMQVNSTRRLSFCLLMTFLTIHPCVPGSTRVCPDLLMCARIHSCVPDQAHAG